MTAVQLAQTSRSIAALPEETLTFSDMICRIMATLKDVVPCDSINFGTIDLESEQAFHFALDGFLMPESRRNLLPLFKHQNPMVEYARKHGTNPPLRFIDFMTRRQFEEVPIYRECYRDYVSSMMTFGVAAPKGLNTSFVLSRASGEFSDKEQEHLVFLQPIISSVVKQQMLSECVIGTHRSATRVGVVHGADLYVHTMDEHARLLLCKYFDLNALHYAPKELHPVLAKHADNILQVAALPNNNQLLCRASPNPSGWTLHLWEEGVGLPSAPLSRFGLTGRQIEIIQWMTLGKTNPEIAVILGISYRTVQKHLENIYVHLGVENRVAAINRCREIAR